MNNTYGVYETNPLPSGHHDRFSGPVRIVKWTTRGLKIIRLRLLSDPGYPYWDVSYCHGMIGDEPVRVSLPFSDLPKSQGIKRAIVEYAKRDGVYARGIGILDNISLLI